MQNRQQDFFHFRKLHPVFTYAGFQWDIQHDQLQVVFHFYDGENHFYPKYIFPQNEDFAISDEIILKKFLFHVGLCEVISYWKASCAPIINIYPFEMDVEAEMWWKKLFFNGLGEFRYLNNIESNVDEFVTFHYLSDKKITPCELSNRQGILVPIGGGKDSVVTLEELSKTKRTQITPFMLNGTPAAQRTVIQAGFTLEKSINVERKLDRALLQLNAKNYLNGHTPFSALLAFVTCTAAMLYKKHDIALSNESSANEATIPGSSINHQYSKSLEFETDFRAYCSKYISPDINYFSYLRPFSEIEIAEKFVAYPQHFLSFRSCNVGSKQDKWCAHCPKCLFVWIILSPYLSVEQLTAIFGQNIGQDITLLEAFKKLSGMLPEKPFECIGTIEEVRNAIVEAYQHGHKDNILYQYFMENIP